MSKKNFRAGHQGSLPSASVQGNQLLMTAQAANQAWVDLNGLYHECVAMCTAPGMAINFRNSPESDKLDRQQLASRMQTIADHLREKQRELGNIKIDIDKGAVRTYNNAEDKMVAALDQAQCLNDWMERYTKTVMVALDDFLELYRQPPLNMQIPMVSGHYQAFNPNEVLADPSVPMVGELLPKSVR